MKITISAEAILKSINKINTLSVIEQAAITDDLQESLAEVNLAFFKFLDGEKDPVDFSKVVGSQLDNYAQINVFSFVLAEIFHDGTGIFNLPLHFKAQLIAYIKTVIDCFDHVLNTGSNEITQQKSDRRGIYGHKEKCKPTPL